jgi:pimeloyl-ACP methyl ester carboxylesterase
MSEQEYARYDHRCRRVRARRHCVKDQGEEMPYADSNGVRLYYEEAGKGTPIVFVHEFAADLRSWEPQIRHFSRRYRCIAFNARGYPPSDVPKVKSAYSQRIAADDIANVMRYAGLASAHIIGCSMGGFATVHFGLIYPRMAKSLTAVGVGSGSDPDKSDQFYRDNAEMASRFIKLGAPEAAKPYQVGPARVQLQNKDPRGFREFCQQFCEHSALGSANTLRGVQMKRPTIYSLKSKLRALKVPLHVISGDEDNNCIDPSLFIKRVCPSACLTIFPATGHAVNLEEVDLFNQIVGEFLAQIDSGRWRPRDPRSFNKSNLLKS